jgi:hypothetical protein
VNDTQNTALGNNPNNSFQPQNHVRCFTHTLNLGVKSFLRPFQPPEKKKKGTTNTDDSSDGDSDTSSELSLELEDSSLSDLADATDGDSLVDDDGGVDEWDGMDEVEKADIIEQTKQAKAIISRVRFIRYFPDPVQDSYLSGPQILVCTGSLDNESAPCLARCLQQKEHGGATSTTGCAHTMELDI